MKTFRVILTEASSVLSWMSKDFTFTVLKGLTGFLIFFEIFGLRLMESSVLSWTFIFVTLLREQPSPSRSSIEDNLHLLRWVSEPEFAFIPHILQIIKINRHWFTKSK